MHSEEKMGMITATPQSFSFGAIVCAGFVRGAGAGWGIAYFVGAHAQQKPAKKRPFGN